MMRSGMRPCSALNVSCFIAPGRPVVWRLYSLSSNLFPETTTCSALTITTYVPMFMDGEYVATLPPRRYVATSVERRPSLKPAASITIQGLRELSVSSPRG